MIDFRLIGTPNGVPIYFQRLPRVKQVSIRLVVFVGAGDDQIAGCDGLMHWFEHVPFNGTEGYPTKEEIIDPIERYGGDLNANTNAARTQYHARVPLHKWHTALNIVTDLVARPLLTDEGIDQEREVIGNEIGISMSRLESWARHKLLPEIYAGHPLGHHTLGSASSLDTVSPDTLRRAYERLYDAKRCCFIVSGDLEESDVRARVERETARLPQRGLSPRQTLPDYGPMKEPPSGKVEIEAPFESSLVIILWPLPAIPQGNRWQSAYLRRRVRGALVEGGLRSPLLHTLRHQKKLVYGASCGVDDPSSFGGYYALAAQTAIRSNIEPLVEGMFEVVGSNHARSPSWDAYVRDSIAGYREMRLDDPHDHTDTQLDRLLIDHIDIPTDEQWGRGLLGVPHGEIVATLDSFQPQNARIFVFRGTKN